MLDALSPSAEDYPLSAPPGWLQPLMSMICIYSIILPHGAIRLSAGGLVFGLFFYLQFWTADRGVNGYATGTGCASIVLRWLDLLVMHRPETEFWSVEEIKQDGSHVKVQAKVPFDRWAKLKWFGSLWIASRGVGWNIQSSQLPPPVAKDYPKDRWLFRTIVRTFSMYLGYDLTSNILLHIVREGPFLAHPIAWQVFYAWTKAFRAYYSFESSYFALAIMSVATGICQPHQWPPLTGSFGRDAYTVRRMWGRCWHQCMRRPSGEAGRVVKETFRLKDGTYLSRYSQICIGFLVSALSHHAGATVGCFEDGGAWQFTYFMLQPAGIMLEDLAIYIGKKCGLRPDGLTRRFGFLWTILWFSWTLRFMVAYQPNTWVTSYSAPSIIGYVMRRSIG
ncbi:uncharacterized protein LY89DRAFT_742739 [Mollisia scopiformis]|uniref:Wax synthase domain-containing protein n=1 Tax=Mollisia scopiformis TaxID=149040 RepID=A0A132B5H6_MOLSC|nr:uncharacterized protein LY89DRAFT_742739 [Mollisia scopiformis]KUJ07503.1 hypothetical protein LY89DRAFT_742739 [Mollisia scopiformis]